MDEIKDVLEEWRKDDKRLVLFNCFQKQYPLLFVDAQLFDAVPPVDAFGHEAGKKHDTAQ